MNIEEYLQLMAMNPQPTPGPAPQNVPHGTMEAPQDVGQFDPLSAGASKAMQSMRETMGMQPRGGIRHMLGRTAGDLAYGFLKGSDHPILQAMAERYESPYDQEEKEIAKNQQIMKFLQEASAAKKLDEYRRQQMELSHRGAQETERHHRASEGMAREKLNIEKGHGEDIRHLEDQFHEEHGVRGKWMGGYKPQLLLSAQKRHSQNIQKHSSAREAFKAAQELHNLSIDNPEIFNSAYFSLLNKYQNNPDLLNTAVQQYVPEESRDALFKAFAASKVLAVQGLQGVPAKGLNMMTDKLLFGAVPGAHMSAAPVTNLTQDFMDESRHAMDHYEKLNDFYNQGFDVMEQPKPRRPEKHPKKMTETEGEAKESPMVTIRNKATGESKQVTLEEAKKMGAR